MLDRDLDFQFQMKDGAKRNQQKNLKPRVVLSLTPHKQEIKMLFIFIFLKKSRMDQKE